MPPSPPADGGDSINQSRARAQRDIIGKQESHLHESTNTIDGNVSGGLVIMGRDIIVGQPQPGPASPPVKDAPGVPISECDPHDLEVHPALQAPTQSGAAGTVPRRDAVRLPAYVRRAHDEELARIVADAAQGGSRMAVLVGSSSTGKTRACWEAVQPLAQQGWRLWHPFDPTRAEAALADLHHIAPHTVVWLNEAQHYLGAANGLGERIAAALHTLLTDPNRAPSWSWAHCGQTTPTPTPHRPPQGTRTRTPR